MMRGKDVLRQMAIQYTSDKLIDNPIHWALHGDRSGVTSGAIKALWLRDHNNICDRKARHISESVGTISILLVRC